MIYQLPKNENFRNDRANHLTMSTNTKICYKAFVGCVDTDCKFAHSIHECKSEIEYAMKGVRFHLPKNDCIVAFLPKMIVRFDEDEEEEEEEKQSISLSQIDAIYQIPEYQQSYVNWLASKWVEAQEVRINHMVEEYNTLTV